MELLLYRKQNLKENLQLSDWRLRLELSSLSRKELSPMNSCLR